jgi:hypothetical protein
MGYANDKEKAQGGGVRGATTGTARHYSKIWQNDSDQAESGTRDWKKGIVGSKRRLRERARHRMRRGTRALKMLSLFF